MSIVFNNRTIGSDPVTLVLDGAMGTQLVRAGMRSDEDQNEYLLSHPEVIESIHRRYVEAGSDLIYAPTFTLNRQYVREHGDELGQIVAQLMAPALRVREDVRAGRVLAQGSAAEDLLVAMDIGPLGEMLEPMGSLTFEEAYDTFRQLVIAGAKAGADLVVIETMTDLYEVRAAVLAARENCCLPVMVSMSFDEGGRTFTGTSLESMAVCLEGLGVDAMGINCSLGPVQILPMIRELQTYTDIPVFAKPNAGLPDPATGTYDITCDQFVESLKAYIDAGVSMVGGCCGTTPEYIRSLAAAVREHEGCGKENAGEQSEEAAGSGAAGELKVSSRSRVVRVDHIAVIGERLNPTGKKRMKQALLDGDFDYILSQAIAQIDAGAEILDVNVGVPGLDDVKMMPRVIKRLQSITDLPLQIDSSNPAAIEAALRVYNGKPIVNSVNGEEKVMDQVLPLVKKYGAAVIGLTLDENGIPATAGERLAIAERIVKRAKEYGIPEHDVIIDCLTLTASAQQKEVDETLKAVRMVREKLGLHAALGVSNVSFGLPLRKVINRTFLTMAMENGLDLPIINPNDEDMMASVFAFNVLKNRDETAAAFIGRYSDEQRAAALTGPKKPAAGAPPAGGTAGGASSAEGGQGPGGSTNAGSGSTNGADPGGAGSTGGPDVFRAIETGMEGETIHAVKALLQQKTEMEIVNEYMIPALDRVGKKFEAGTLFLPQMLQAASAAQAGFEVIRERLAESDSGSVDLGEVVIATVRGDIHDIGKNIVKVIMDNYGFHMIDLGKNVPAEEIVEIVKERGIRLVGLSALMTTTLKSMEETIAAIREASPDCRVMVGGAVLTEEYAKSIGADYYCSDAMRSVEAAQEVFGDQEGA